MELQGRVATAAAARLSSGAAWACDVRDRAQVSAVIGQVEATFGPIDILVNSAGIWRHT